MSQDKMPTKVYDLVYALWRRKFGTCKAYESEKDEPSVIEMLQDLFENSANKASKPDP